MGIGAYRHQVNIVQRSAGRDAAGQKSVTWVPLASGVWSDVRHQGGLEVVRGGEDVSIVKASVRLRRYRDDLTEAMRVVHGTRVYDIKAVLPDGLRRHVDLVCELVAPGG